MSEPHSKSSGRCEEGIPTSVEGRAEGDGLWAGRVGVSREAEDGSGCEVLFAGVREGEREIVCLTLDKSFFPFSLSLLAGMGEVGAEY